MVKSLGIRTHRQGLLDITAQIEAAVSASTVRDGLCTVFIRHTSASLIIQENADPSAKHDLETWLNRLVSESDPMYTHTTEGADDMPAHIKTALTSTHLAIPIVNGRLGLGTWQGIYLWEHRHGGGHRELLVHVGE